MTLVISKKYTTWAPDLISTALWLDAADATTITTVSGAVSQWNDKSGNGRNVLQSTAGNRPTTSTFNSKTALSFNGSSNFLQSGASITTGTYTGYFNIFWVGTRLSFGGCIFTERAAAQVGASQWFNSSGSFISSDGANSSSNHTISDNDFNLLQSGGGMVYHSHVSGSRDVLYLNGAQITVTSGTANNITGSTSNFRVGAREGSVGQYWNGLICEIIITLSTTSTFERQKAEGYLAHKWGLTANLPNDHPYKWSKPPV